MKQLNRGSQIRTRQVSFPPTLPLAPRSPNDSRSAIDARMPTPYAFSGLQTFEDPAGSGDEAEDNEPEGTVEVLITSNVRTGGAEDVEFDTTEEGLIKANNVKRSRQDIEVETTKIVFFIRFGNTLEGSIEFKILNWDSSLAAIYPSCRLEKFFNTIYSAAKIAALGIISPHTGAKKSSNLTTVVEEAFKETQRIYDTETEELVEGDCVFILDVADDSRRLVSLNCNALNSTFSFTSLWKDNSYNITCSEVAADFTIERPPMSSKEVENKRLNIHHTRETTEAAWAGESNVIDANLGGSGEHIG